MPKLRAHLLCLTAMSGTILSVSPASAGTQLPLWGFEDGTLSGWTSHGGAEVLATDSLTLGSTTFELGAKGNYMAKILPNGSNVMRTEAETLLGLTSGTFAGSADGLANGTNFGLLTTSTYLAAGDYSFGWSYAAQDYAPFDDGVFFSLAGNGVSSVSILASNFTGQTDTVLVGTYGSTPWRLTNFTIATAGTYQLGFGAYNNRDEGVDPVLFLDNGIGKLSANGVVIEPATPDITEIDNQQPYYVITNVENGSILPVFDGGTLLVDAAGTYTNPMTINGQGGTINSNGLDALLSGTIEGTGGLTKIGDGVLTLTAANSYTGGTTIQGGTLAIKSNSIVGNIVNNAVLQIDVATEGSFGGDISGTGMLVKTGSGALTLSGSNEGLNTSVADGKLVIASQQAIGTTGGNVTLVGGATLQTDSNLTISQIVNFVSGGNAAGDGATIDTGAHDVTLAGGGTGNACLIKVGAGTLNVVSHLQNSIGACVNQGAMNFNNVFDGNVTVANTAKISGSGVINGNVSASGIVAPGNSPGVLVVNGSVSQQAGSTLALDIDGATAGNGAGHHDALVLNGAGSVYTAGGRIAPVLRGITGDASNNFTPAIGQTFEVVTAAGGVTGSFEGVTQPTIGMPANSRFDVIYRSNALLLVVTPGLYSLMGGETNASAAGGALDAIRPAAGVRSATSGRIFERLAGLNETQIGATLEQLSGSVHASAMDATLQGNRAARGAILQHLKVERAAAEGSMQRRGLWATASNLDGTVKADRSGRGYQHDSQAYAVGFDVAPGADWTVGIAGTYGESKADAGLLGTGKTESYRAGLYAIWARAGSFATAQFGVSKDKYNLRRVAPLAATTAALTADADGTSLGIEIEAGHRFKLGPIGLTPLFGASYDRVSRDGMQEAGSTDVALTFGKGHRTAWTGRAGARLDSGTAIAKGQVRAYASGVLVGELGDRSTSLAPSLQGASFRIVGTDAGKTAFQGEAGLTGALSSRIEVNVGYRHLSSGNAHANGVNGTLRIRW